MASIVSPKDNRFHNKSSDIRGHNDTGVVLAKAGLAACQVGKTSIVKF
jgi:hypothetical protein